MADSAVEFTGIEKMQKKLAEIERNVMDNAGKRLYQQGLVIMRLAKREYVPVAPDGGTLRDSGHVERPKKVGDNVEVALVFGGPAAAYALAIHEHPSGSSPPSWEGKTLNFHLGGNHGTKYLERPLMAATDKVINEIGKGILDG